MDDVVRAFRQHLIDSGIVRDPGVAGAGGRPWLPPAWRHPDDGAPGPGDAKDQGKDAVTFDDGVVVSIFWAPGIPPDPGGEDRRRAAVDVWVRSNAVPAALALEGAIRREIVGDPPVPGGMTDWVMGGLYVIQSIEWKAWQPLEASNDVFTFLVGYLFEIRAA